jgi:hypothetical protein
MAFTALVAEQRAAGEPLQRSTSTSKWPQYRIAKFCFGSIAAIHELPLSAISGASTQLQRVDQLALPFIALGRVNL